MVRSVEGCNGAYGQGPSRDPYAPVRPPQANSSWFAAAVYTQLSEAQRPPGGCPCGKGCCNPNACASAAAAA